MQYWAQANMCKYRMLVVPMNAPMSRRTDAVNLLVYGLCTIQLATQATQRCHQVVSTVH